MSIMVELKENEDYIVFTQKGENYGGRPRTDYALTLDSAKHISLASRLHREPRLFDNFIKATSRGTIKGLCNLNRYGERTLHG